MEYLVIVSIVIVVSVFVLIGIVKLLHFFDNVNKKNNFENTPEYKENKKLFDKLVIEFNFELKKFGKYYPYKSDYIARYEEKIIIFSITQPSMAEIECDEHYEYGCHFVTENKKGEISVKESISISNIVFFCRNGNVQYTTGVYGGGSSISGSLIGGVFGGAAGAIIGSRKSVHSYTQKHDSRKTIVKLEDGELEYDSEMYDVLVNLIPKKEYNYIMTKSVLNKNIEEKSISSSVADELIKYKTLLDNNIITQEEFDKKKKELL